MRISSIINKLNQVLKDTNLSVYHDTKESKFYVLKDYYNIIYSSNKVDDVINYVMIYV